MKTKPSRSITSSRARNTTERGGKRIATAERRFNRRRYAALLAKAAPRVITGGEELERVSKLVDSPAYCGLFDQRREVVVRIIARIFDKRQGDLNFEYLNTIKQTGEIHD